MEAGNALMTWLRKAHLLLAAVVVFGFFVLPEAADWIDSSIAGVFS